VVLDRSRAVILDLTALRHAEWRDYFVACARELDWPAGTLLEVDRRGCWHAHLGTPAYPGARPFLGSRWSAWFLPDVHEMITRAVRGVR